MNMKSPASTRSSFGSHPILAFGAPRKLPDFMAQQLSPAFFRTTGSNANEGHPSLQKMLKTINLKPFQRRV